MANTDNSTVQNVDLDRLADPDNEDKSGNTDFDMEGFFEQLDRQYNGAVFDDATPVDNTPDLPEEGSDSDSTPADANVSDEVGKLREELETVKKRYGDSSREAKELRRRLDDLEQYEAYVPILRAMREDPGLIQHVRSYLQGNDTPTSIREGLDLPEDFVFDPDEAVRNPNSDSGKVLETMINKSVERRLKQYSSVQDEARRREDADRVRRDTISKFQESNKLTDEEMGDLIDFSKQHTLTMEDIYYLKNRQKREEEIAKKVVEEMNKQRGRMANTPRTLSTVGKSGEPADLDKLVLDQIKKATGDSLFD